MDPKSMERASRGSRCDGDTEWRERGCGDEGYKWNKRAPGADHGLEVQLSDGLVERGGEAMRFGGENVMKGGLEMCLVLACG